MHKIIATFACALSLFCTAAPAGAVTIWASAKPNSEIADFIIINNTPWTWRTQQYDGNWYTDVSSSWSYNGNPYSTSVIPKMNVSSSSTSHGILSLFVFKNNVLQSQITIGSDTFKDATTTQWVLSTTGAKPNYDTDNVCFQNLDVNGLRYSLMMRNVWDDNRNNNYSGNAKVILMISDLSVMDFSLFPTTTGSASTGTAWGCTR